MQVWQSDRNIAQTMTLIIRHTQFDAFEHVLKQQFTQRMCSHVRLHFAAQSAAWDATHLRANVCGVIDRAGAHGFVSEQDSARYLNLAMLFGLHFDTLPDHAWMRARLEDGSISNPSERLALLVSECLRRLRVADNNRALSDRFAPPPDTVAEPEWSPSDDEFAMQYGSMQAQA